MAHEATRSACFKPNDYRDLTLFANRYELRERLAADLESYVDPEGSGEACILIRGNRGVGKSMLVRWAVDKMVRRAEVLRVEVDCVRIQHGLERTLRELAKALAREAIENALDEGLRAQAEALLRLAEQTKVKVREVKTWATKLKLGTSLQYSFMKLLQFEFGIERAGGRSREVEELSEKTIDAPFLQRFILGFVEDCKRRNTRVLLLVDNLDQVVYAEAKEDIVQVTDLASFLSELPGCVVVMTVRTEFISTDMTKLKTQSWLVPGMLPEELCEVASTRMKAAAASRRARLKEAHFEEIAKSLSAWTNNAWAFLCWLQELDFSEFEAAPDDKEGLKDVLLSVMRHDFVRLSDEDLERLGRAFEGSGDGFRTADDLKDAGISSELLKTALQCSALIPRYLLSNDDYMLSPLLHFLV